MFVDPGGLESIARFAKARSTAFAGCRLLGDRIFGLAFVFSVSSMLSGVC